MELTAEQQQIVKAVRELATEFEETAFQGEDVPMENLELLAENGFLGINFPVEYGGGGMNEIESLLVIQSVGTICPDTAALLSEQQMIAPRAIAEFGSEAAKEHFLSEVCAGESYVAIAISEPEAGSDVQNMSTTVRETDNGLRMSGQKTWISRIELAQYAVVWTRFPDDDIGSVVVDLDAPGVELTSTFTNMAGHTQGQLDFDDVAIPEEHVLLRGPDGFRKQLDALNWERVSTAMILNSMAEIALERGLEYAETREQFGQSVSDFQGIEWKLADMLRWLETSRAVTVRAVQHSESKGRVLDPLDATIAKLVATNTAERVVDEGLQLHGANGFQQGHPLEYLYRFVRGYRIAGGTDEILKNTIARQLERNGVPSLIRS